MLTSGIIVFVCLSYTLVFFRQPCPRVCALSTDSTVHTPIYGEWFSLFPHVQLSLCEIVTQPVSGIRPLHLLRLNMSSRLHRRRLAVAVYHRHQPKLGPVLLFSFFFLLVDTLIQKIFFYIMIINIFQGDLTDISAEKALTGTRRCWIPIHG